MQLLGSCFGVAGAAMKYRDELEFDTDNLRWIKAPAPARTGRRTIFYCEDREISSGQLVAVRVWGRQV